MRLLRSKEDLISARELCRKVTDLAQIQFSGAQIWERFNGEELVGSRQPKIRQATLAELLETMFKLVLWQDVQNH
jgi:hypothetical protein